MKKSLKPTCYLFLALVHLLELIHLIFISGFVITFDFVVTSFLFLIYLTLAILHLEERELSTSSSNLCDN